MAEKLPNPFESRGAAKGPETEDFIAFSSNSTPGDRFVPKRGKKNRQDNWRRFGNFENQQQQNYYSPRGRGGMGYPGSSEYFTQKNSVKSKMLNCIFFRLSVNSKLEPPKSISWSTLESRRNS